METAQPTTYGLMARFATAQQLLDATVEAKAAGYSKLDAFTPFPVEAISEEVCDHKPSLVSRIVLGAGITGALTGFFGQWWVAAVAYPVNIGGRPTFSWPAFVPVTFEVTVLFSAFTAVIAMLALNRLPQPYHPVFNVPGFERATVDRYFLLIEAEDPRFDPAATRDFLRRLGPEEVHDVAP